MIDSLFLNILNISLTAGYLILVIIILRFIFKKLPKWSLCILWGIVAIRLIMPFSIESVLSLVPSAKVIPEEITTADRPAIDSGFKVINNAINPIVENSFTPNAEDSVNPLQMIIRIVAIVWAFGVVCMLFYALLSYMKLKRHVKSSFNSTYEGMKINCSDKIESPFILGIISPSIYIPSTLDEKTKKYVIAHEQAHLKRGDHFWKPLGFLLLSIYWFNPICWVAYILLCHDIESACDERVIKDKEKDYLVSYSQALLDLNIQRRRLSACPLAFGETDVKARIKGVINYKKPAFWVVFASIICVTVVTVCFLTNPKGKDVNDVSIEQNNMDDSDTMTDYNEENNDNNDKITIKRMLMVDGVLYVDTGYVSGISGRCGTLEGNITSVISEGKVPDKDGEANFEATGYQWGFQSGTIEVPINNEWYIFAEKGSDIFTKGEIPQSVLQFVATVTEVIDDENDEYIIVEVTSDVASMFSNSVKKGNRYKLSTKKYDSGIYEDKPAVGNVVIIACKGVFLETDPAIIGYVYYISPIGSSPCVILPYDISDWVIDIKIPEEYSFSNYDEMIGYGGGFLLLPKVNEGREGTPEEWLYSGMLTRCPAKSTSIKFSDGLLQPGGVPIHNHTVVEYIDVIGAERSNWAWQAIMLEEKHEINNAGDMNNSGDYWYFWFAKDGEEYYYVLSLSEEEFTKKEAIDIAYSLYLKAFDNH
ncbi:MAG: M56 family metallopeptidase [Lachnospiraceae bacterium]|nr:M56 family metallopeptidase [Lachnospiraceae bacterium]